MRGSFAGRQTHLQLRAVHGVHDQLTCNKSRSLCTVAIGGTRMSSTKSVIANANTPSLRAASRSSAPPAMLL
jgi:thiamine monophosphate synthase